MLYRIGRSFFSRYPRFTTGLVGSVARRIPLAIRHGRDYRETRRLLESSQWWSRKQLEAYQLQELKKTVALAYEVSPFYRGLYARAGVRPDDLRSLDDIRRFPTISKDDLREHLEGMINPAVDRRTLIEFCTGGTTGPGVVIPFEESYRNRSRAFMWHLWERVGYRPSMLAAILQHRQCPPDVNDGIWYMEKPSNAVVLSAHRLSAKTVDRYVEALLAHRPRVLIAYPSLAYLFASYLRQIGFEEQLFDLVILGSETLYEFQRHALEEVFHAKVRIHYGHIESCTLFGYCEDSNVYHVQMEYGFTEFVRDDGGPAGPGEVGEVVATNFANRALPLVRYRTGDMAQPADGVCECGRQYPLVEQIVGRKGDFIQTPSGAKHAPILIEFLMDRILLDGRDRFADLQIVQTRLDQIVVRVVPGHHYHPEDVENFCRLLDQELHGEVRVSHETVAEIPRTDRQKKSLVVSLVEPPAGA
jgi:phenylacetate-CoA ligase